MQNTKKMELLLERFSDRYNFMFTPKSFRSAFPNLSDANLNQILCRANRSGLMERVCKGVYIYTKAEYDPSIVLFLAAKALRFDEFMYVGLETSLSAYSAISQQMLSFITIVTSGRSSIIDCSRFGKIEFVHSDNAPDAKDLYYDKRTGLFWSNEDLALNDMKKHRRKLVTMLEDYQ